MNFMETNIPGLWKVELPRFTDLRGSFMKTFQENPFREKGLETRYLEQYVTVSAAGVLRGLHFQVPPHHHAKIVACLTGEVFDAVVDLRRGSTTFTQHETFRLSGERPMALYIPPGLAHGFYVLDGPATMLYNTSTVHSPDHDLGIAWDSAGIHWPGRDPVLSDRDREHPALEGWDSPFLYEETP